MRLLLDTHAFLWWALGDRSLSDVAQATIDDRKAQVFVSAASAWELATKYRIGKLPHAEIIANDVARAIARNAFEQLLITVAHAETSGRLPGHHGDPFDRMLIAQALTDGLTLVSNETLFDAYGVTRLW